LKTIAEKIHYFVELERFYWGSTNVIRNLHFEDALVEFYREILLYEAKCACYFNLETAKRTIRNIFQVDGWADLLKNIEKRESHCLQFNQILSHSNQAEFQAEHKRQLADLQTSIDRLYEAEDHNAEIIRWISNVTAFQDHHYVRNQKLTPDHWAESGTWLLDNPNFIEWSKATQGQIWLQGTVGTGKSCLTSIIINRLLETFPDDHLAFFYCSGDRADNATIVFRSLVAQLSCAADGTLLDHMKAIYKEKSGMDSKGDFFSVSRCVELLGHLIKHHGGATIVIDALDECADDYWELLLNLNTLQKQAQNLKLFVSSRPEVPVADHFNQVERIEVDWSKNSEDIEKYIKGELKKPERRKPTWLTDKMIDDLKNVLMTHAGGM
jgi:hypothetical protein